MKKIINLLICMAISFSCGLSHYQTINAKEEVRQINGKIYEFKKDDSYAFKKDNGESTNKNKNTYGKLNLNGQVLDVGKKGGFVSYETRGPVSFVYTYSDALLNAKEEKWHLYEDSLKEINSVKLDNKIRNGAIVLQVSEDGKNWKKKYEVTNVFEDIPIQSEAFYQPNTVQLNSGYYYRVMVAFELEKKTGTKKNKIGWDEDQFEYKRFGELYEFYLYDEVLVKEEEIDTKFALGEKVKAKKGYDEDGKVENGDVHFGWNLGQFYLTGYTEKKEDNGVPVFLKNVGDKLSLKFELQQDIDSLNNNDNLSIVSDEKGYDNHFELDKQNFGRGMLIIRKTNYQNVKEDPVSYVSYLEAGAQKGVETTIEVFEEGNYEVSLDYQIADKSNMIHTSVTNYKIMFEFYIRNGNRMVFPFDVSTQEELMNGSNTPNGFYLDLAKSRYLDIQVKHETLNKKTGTLDTRFNRPSKDKENFTKEGVYTITVRNQYLEGEPTEKILYVGNNDLLKAYVKTGLPLEEIKRQIDNGATVDSEGNIYMRRTGR